MKIGIYPGSFDPVTAGHFDIIKRAKGLFDLLIVAVLKNSSKHSLFTIEERVTMLRDLTIGMEHVKIDSFEGLLIDFARENRAGYIVRGLRSMTDFEFEMQFARGNNRLAPELETIFFVADIKQSFVSSSIVKEIAMHGGDITEFVPDSVIDKIYTKYGKDVTR